MVTAAASLIVAVAGLLTAVSQFRGDEKAPAAGTVAGATTTRTVVADQSEEELRMHIPKAIVSTCKRATDGEPGAVAALNCYYRTIIGVQYNLYATRAEMKDGYKEVKRRYDLAAASDKGSCGKGMYEDDYDYDDEPAGKFLCFIDESGPVSSIVWTDEVLDILSFVWRDDRKLGALYEAWEEGVGPDR